MLTQAAHTVELLASGRDFNVRTNHGVMQNVALLQLLLSMPPLDQGREYLSRALRRLEAQVAFLYSQTVSSSNIRRITMKLASAY